MKREERGGFFTADTASCWKRRAFDVSSSPPRVGCRQKGLHCLYSIDGDLSRHTGGRGIFLRDEKTARQAAFSGTGDYMMCSSQKLSSTRIPIFSGEPTVNFAMVTSSKAGQTRFSGFRRSESLISGTSGCCLFFFSIKITSELGCSQKPILKIETTGWTG